VIVLRLGIKAWLTAGAWEYGVSQMLRAYALADKADACYCKVDVARRQMEGAGWLSALETAGGLTVVATRYRGFETSWSEAEVSAV
jgi:hypothetical protein